ncbi:MAG: PIN domain-containing protein [Candidatus Diapherotrites archaeon]|uniref:PIN domain-containing protein n=1 Tax=Candidatus Iainarchaeum sp. TaxID=3101447 RepID=A0A8T3YIU7_9ARCH|nr:PIN domain-containing protein [Candidatus Diapherotrites archaeon]
MTRYYLETTVFAYLALSMDERWHHAAAIIKAMQEGAFVGVTSFVTFEELVFLVLKNKGREAAMEAGRNFLMMGNLEIVNATRDTANLTVEAMEQVRLMPRDAIHYAVAKERGLEAMVTEDRDFNKAREIRKYGMKAFVEKIGVDTKAGP